MSKPETERRRRTAPTQFTLAPSDAFPDKSATADDLAAIRPDADTDAVGPHSQTIGGMPSDACASWRVHPTSVCRSHPAPGRRAATADPPDQHLYDTSSAPEQPMENPTPTESAADMPDPKHSIVHAIPPEMFGRLIPSRHDLIDLPQDNNRSIGNQLDATPEAVAEGRVKIHPPRDRPPERRALYPQDHQRRPSNQRRTPPATPAEPSSRRLGK